MPLKWARAPAAADVILPAPVRAYFSLSSHTLQFKQKITFLNPRRELPTVLELARAADLIVLVLPVKGSEDDCVDEVLVNDS